MDTLIHRTPSVGGITQKILAINPDLSVMEIVSIVRSASYKQGIPGSDFGDLEAVSESKAIELARATLSSKSVTAINK